MTVRTQVRWQLPINVEANGMMDAINLKSSELTASGKEIATFERTVVDNNQMLVTRTWADEETALSWVAFIQPYGPISATVLN